MQISPQGVAEIVGHEGIVLSPYRDSVGVWTFGVGHTAKAGPPDPARMARGVKRPLQEALDTLERDLRRFEDRVNRALEVTVRQHEFDALVSFDFNTGGIFRARLTRLLNAGDRAGAADAFDGWHRPAEIIERRNAEKRLFRDGVYAHGGMAALYAATADGRVDGRSATRINVGELLRAPPRQPDDPGDGRSNDELGEGHGSDGGADPAIAPGCAVEVGSAGAAAAVGVFLSAVVWWMGLAVIFASFGWLVWRFRAPIGRALKAFGAGVGRLIGRLGRWARTLARRAGR